MMENSREIDLLNSTEAEKIWLNNINREEGCNYRVDTTRPTAVSSNYRMDTTRPTAVRESPARLTPARAIPVRPIPASPSQPTPYPVRPIPASPSGATPYISMTMKEPEKQIHISEQERPILASVEPKSESFRRDVKEKVDLEDVFMSCSGYLALTLIFLFFLIAPGVMLYAGIKHQYCEDIFAVWLIIGGVLCYVNFIMAIVYIYAKKTQSPKIKWKEDRGVYRSGLITLCTFSVMTVIWWVFGFGRVFAPARSYMRNPSSFEASSKGILGESWMNIASCKQFLFDFPFWLTLCPFMFMGLFFLWVFILACVHFATPDDD